MDEAAITQYIQERFTGVDVVVASKENEAPEPSWGDTFFFYDPQPNVPADHRFPFATIVMKDYEGFDSASNLDRPGIFRLNIGVNKEIFDSLFRGKTDEGHDFAALDEVMPHPVYGNMSWVCVLNPSDTTFREKVTPLLADAYARAAQKSKK